MESYRILYRIKVEHGYFDGEPCPALQCRLTPQGEVLARRRGMLFRQTAPGEWTLLFHTRPTKDDILMLDLSICDSGFTLYTAWSGFRPSADYMLELPARRDGAGRADVRLRAGHQGEPARALLHLARRAGELLRLRLSPAPLRLRADDGADPHPDAERHQPCHHPLRAAHRVGGRVVRGATCGGRVADTAHLHRRSHQQP